jgi:uncharacterized protein YlxW (UPF0749 family)
MLNSTEVTVLISVLACILGGGAVIVAINSRQLRKEETERKELHAAREHEKRQHRIEQLEAESPDYESWLQDLHSKSHQGDKALVERIGRDSTQGDRA